MKFYNETENINDSHKKCAIAIGNFDGVHRGHKQIFNKAKDIAKASNKPFGVLTFEPHPKNLFNHDNIPFRITPIKSKIRRISNSNPDFISVHEFNHLFAKMSASDFIQNILINTFEASHIIVGNDFHFGHNREGNIQHLKDSGFKVTVLDKISDEDDGIYSSTRVREEIKEGNIRAADNILGWEWEIEGKIIHGDKRGRELGFPTANVELGETIHPSYGVYACMVKIENEKIWRKAAVNIGIRPMFKTKTALVESYIFDFDDEIYGKILRIKPMTKIRNEMKFESIEKLIEQIKDDCELIKSITNA